MMVKIMLYGGLDGIGEAEAVTPSLDFFIRHAGVDDVMEVGIGYMDFCGIDTNNWPCSSQSTP